MRVQTTLAHNDTAKRIVVTARKEIILSAGAIGTPQILMLSGIGNAEDLKSLAINPVVDLPDVGQHLQDHPIMSNYFVVNSNNTQDNVSRDPAVAAAWLEQWNETRTGLFASTGSNTLGFLRVPENSSIFENYSDPSAGELSGHYEIIFTVNHDRVILG